MKLTPILRSGGVAAEEAKEAHLQADRRQVRLAHLVVKVGQAAHLVL